MLSSCSPYAVASEHMSCPPTSVVLARSSRNEPKRDRERDDWATRQRIGPDHLCVWPLPECDKHVGPRGNPQRAQHVVIVASHGAGCHLFTHIARSLCALSPGDQFA
jgi:hypothetical protein